MKLLAATGNAGKLKEIKSILAPYGVETVGLKEAGITLDAEENGGTFLENALIKARACREITGLPVLADDSGLTVGALGGRPGVKSARYAGENATDGENVAKLLAELTGVPEGKRGAAFVCSMVYIDADGEVFSTEGRVEGSITTEPRGKGGFGYDPVFLIAGTGATMAEADESLKNSISHRALALAAMAGRIKLKRMCK